MCIWGEISLTWELYVKSSYLCENCDHQQIFCLPHFISSGFSPPSHLHNQRKLPFFGWSLIWSLPLTKCLWISTGWYIIISLWGHFWAAPDKFSAGLAWKNLWPLEGTGGQWAANNVNRWGRSPPGFLWKRRSSAHCKIASAICRNQEVWEKSVGKLYIPPAAGRTTNSCTLQIKLFQK